MKDIYIKYKWEIWGILTFVIIAVCIIDFLRAQVILEFVSGLLPKFSDFFSGTITLNWVTISLIYCLGVITPVIVFLAIRYIDKGYTSDEFLNVAWKYRLSKNHQVYPNSLKPTCSKCGTEMMIFNIEISSIAFCQNNYCNHSIRFRNLGRETIKKRAKLLIERKARAQNGLNIKNN